MKYLIAAFLSIHGIAHLVGFVVPWKIAQLEEMPYSTTILSTKIDLGDTGIKIFGVFWLILALAFFLSIYFIFSHNPLWFVFTICASLFSIIFCILGLPDAKIGVFANILILLGLFVLQWFDWIVLD